MKGNWRTIVFVGLLGLSVCLLPQISTAQPPGEDISDPDTPIDGGLSILIAAGVGYGIKKYRDERKKNKTGDLK